MNKRKNRAIAAIVGAGALALSLTPLALAPKAEAQGPTGATSLVTPSSFGNAVNELVQSRFAKSYAGVVINKSSVTVYTAAQKSSIANAIQKISGASKIKYSVISVPHSFAWMEQLSHRMAQNSKATQSLGVSATGWWPDPATGEVDVYLSAPTTADRTALASAMRAKAGAVTTANYRQKAATLLQQRFGSGIKVESTYHPIATVADAPDVISPASRRNDTPPYNGGDNIVSSEGETCTGGFAIEGNATGDTFMLTGGHCGGGTWYVGGIKSQVMGTVAHYFYDDDQNDFEMIGTSAIGFLWGGSASDPVVYTVTGGAYLPPEGAGISWDGSLTREVRNIDVYKVGACQEFEDDEGIIVNVCNLIVSPNLAPQVVQQGDSGGPVYQHTCETCTTVKPIGTIVGGISDPEYDQYWAFAEYLGTELSYANSSVIDG